MGLSPWHSAIKRIFDFGMALVGLVLTFWIILLAWLASSIDTKSNGFFFQERVGRNGKLFRVVKIRTMSNVVGSSTTVTRSEDPRITRLGAFLRRTKIDELPQLYNVLIGDMSFVGPRPDVPGFADSLVGDDRVILSIRPGITGPATLEYRNEEAILDGVDDFESYNREVIWPDKVRINREYIEHYAFGKDIVYILQTVFSRRLKGSGNQSHQEGC